MRKKMMGGGMMRKPFSTGSTPTTPKEKKFAALAPPKDVMNFSDKIAGAKKTKSTKRKQVMGGGSIKRRELKGGGGLYANIKAKQDRIADGSGETMRKVGDKGAPTAQNFKDAAKTAKPVKTV